MNWKIIIAAIIAIIVFGHFAYESYNYIESDSSEIKLDISSEIEELTSKEEINISKKKSMNTNDGFFKSAGKIMIRSDNASDYVSTAKNEGLTEIYFVFEKEGSYLTKRYWTLSEDKIFEYKETYKNNFDRRSVYTFQSHNDTEIIFEKNYFWTFIWLIFIIGIYSLISACITYVILYIIERVYEYVFNR